MWLTRFFQRKDAYGYTEGERDIFTYWDGVKRRKGDPLAIQRALLTDPKFDIKFDPDIAKVPTLDGLKAVGRLIDATRRAFKVPDFEKDGLTDGECLNLFHVFSFYIGQLQEEARPLASSPGPTASAPDVTPTETSVASGSTASVPAEVPGG